MLETLLIISTILLTLITAMLFAHTVYLTKRLLKNQERTISTDLSTPSFPEADQVHQTNTIGDTSLEKEQVLKEQAQDVQDKKAKKEEEALAKTVIASTERYNQAITNTMNEIMYGIPSQSENKKEGSK